MLLDVLFVVCYCIVTLVVAVFWVVCIWFSMRCCVLLIVLFGFLVVMGYILW